VSMTIRRLLGIGDQVFVLLAAYAYFRETEERVTFVGSDVWGEEGPPLGFIDWIHPSKSENLIYDMDYDTVLPRDDIDRATLFANLIGIDKPASYLPWEVDAEEDKSILIAPYGGGGVVTRTIPVHTVINLMEILRDCFPDYTITITDSRRRTEYDNIPAVNATGLWNIHQLLRHIKAASVIISVDSGTAYLAASMQKPTVIVFTHIDPSNRIGWAGDNVVVVTPPPLPCWPCGDFPWPEAPCPDVIGRCALSIQAEAIADALWRFWQ